MESHTRDSSSDFSSFSRSGNKGKPEANGILISVPRSFSMRIQCISCRLDRNVCVYISSSHINSEGIQESGTGVVCMASIHKGGSNSSVSNNVDLSKLIKKIYDSQPNVRPLLPNWDLPTVIWKLFESCEEMKFLPRKTCSL